MRKRDLKQKYPELNINLIDLITLLDPSKTNKYAPLLIEEFKERLGCMNEEMMEYRQYVKNQGVNVDDVEGFINLRLLNEILSITGSHHVELLRDFENYCQRNLIENKNIYSYKTFDDIKKEVDKVHLKLLDKKEYPVHISFEDEEYLMIKPLTIDSSRKYGSGTKWCTSSLTYPDHFYSYSRSGVLLYIFNKQNGLKFGCHVRFNDQSSYSSDIQFFDDSDKQRDSFEINLPPKIMNLIIHEKSLGVTNEEFIKQNYYDTYLKYWGKPIDEGCILVPPPQEIVGLDEPELTVQNPVDTQETEELSLFASSVGVITENPSMTISNNGTTLMVADSNGLTLLNNINFDVQSSNCVFEKAYLNKMSLIEHLIKRVSKEKTKNIFKYFYYILVKPKILFLYLSEEENKELHGIESMDNFEKELNRRIGLGYKIKIK